MKRKRKLSPRRALPGTKRAHTLAAVLHDGECRCAKRRFHNRGDAARHAARLESSRADELRNTGVYLGAYQCPTSGWWHIGHKSAAGRAQLREQRQAEA